MLIVAQVNFTKKNYHLKHKLGRDQVVYCVGPTQFPTGFSTRFPTRFST